jgi:hypothetical protein
MRVLSVLFALTAVAGVSLPALAAEPVHIYGIHSWGSGANGLFHGRRGWTCESVNTANYAFDLQPAQAQQIVNENFELIIRINKQAGLTVPTNSAEWDQFAADAATKADTFKQWCHIWIIGNEMNASFEGNVPYTTYAEVYRRCRTAIRAVQPEAVVLVGAVAPWNSSQQPSGPYPSNRPWLNYMHRLVTSLGADADGYAIHAYGGRGGDTDPRNDDEMAFGVFKRWLDVMNADPVGATRPAFLTEMNHAADGDQAGNPGFPKYAYPAGYITRLYEAVGTWNQQNGYRIRCACWFSYANGGFPGYNISTSSPMQSDMSAVTQDTDWLGVAPTAAHDWWLLE